MQQEKTIRKIVMMRYPVTSKEKACAREKQKREWLRDEYRKKLIDEWQREKRVFNTVPAGKQEV